MLRVITAQALDYGSWVKELSAEEVTHIAEEHLPERLEDAFAARFGAPLPETLNENHRLLIVGSAIDASSERIIRYLSDAAYGVNINAATFQYFRESSGAEFLTRVFLIEPDQVERQSRTKGGSKRQPNLTYEELDAIAGEKGVTELYRHAAASLEQYLQKHTTRSSIGFAGNFDGRKKTVISLIPQESNPGDGLRFQVYQLRLRTLLNLSEDASLALLPQRREPWIYHEDAGPDYEGFRGFFASRGEIDRFLVAFGKPPKGAATPK